MSSWDYDGKRWYQSPTVWAIICLGVMDGLLGYVQAAEIISNKSSEGVSLVAFVFYLISNLAMLIWGSLGHDAALLVTSSVSVLGGILVLSCIYAYAGEHFDPKPVSLQDSRVPIIDSKISDGQRTELVYNVNK